MSIRSLSMCFAAALALACGGPAGSDPELSTEARQLAGTPLRYLAINAGNASILYGCWEYKLCRSTDVANLRSYIATWKPDVIMLSEVYRSAQLTGTANYGPILPAGYTGQCGQSRDRSTGALAAYDAANASHEHECVAWKTSRLSLVAGSARSAYGRNDSWGQSNCNYDFTGFKVDLTLDGSIPLTAVAVHPDSGTASCRTEEIARYWSTLATGTRTILGGDFNTESSAELQVPAAFRVNYSFGNHWGLVQHTEYTAFYVLGISYQYDHAFSTFGSRCIDCGPTYGTASLGYGSVVGGYENHPRADNGSGMDHRQILVDMQL